MESYTSFILACEKLEKALNENESQQMHKALNEINSFKYPCSISSSHAEAVLNKIIIIDTKVTDGCLLSKFLLLINYMLLKQRLTTSSNTFSLIVNWVLHIEKNHKSLVIDVIDLLRRLLKNYHPIDVSILERILDTKFIENHLQTRSYTKIDAITLSTVKLIETISFDVYQSHSNLRKNLEQVAKNCLDILTTIDYTDFQQNYFDLATHCLSIIRHVIHFSSEWIEDSPSRLPLLIGCFKLYITLDVDRATVLQLKPVQPSQLSLFEPNSLSVNNNNRMIVKNNKKKPRVHDKIKKVDAGKVNNSRPFCNNISESDYSEKENEASPEKFISDQKLKLRLMTINLVITLAQTVDKKLLFGYFHTFFAEPSGQSLLLVITFDSSVICRISALQATTLLLFKFRQYLLLAQIKDNNATSFTPLAVAIGNTLITLYNIFANILAKEAHTDILIQTLKATSTLIEVTSQSRCQVDVLSKIVPQIKQLLKLRDVTLRVACLNVMQTIFLSEGINEKYLKQLIFSPDDVQTKNENFDYNVNMELSEITNKLHVTDISSNKENNWLLIEIFTYLGVFPNSSPIQNFQLKIQCLQTLQGIATFVHFYVTTDLSNIAKAIKFSLSDQSLDVKLHAARTHEAITRNLNKIIVEDVNNRQLLEFYYRYWNELQEIVTTEIQDDGTISTHRSILIDSLVNVECIYDRLSRERQLFLVSFINGTAYEDEPRLKASAIRCLSIFSRFSSLREDIDFLMNAIEISVNSLLFKKSDFIVKLKASWALANFSDLFVDAGRITVGIDSVRSIFEACITEKDCNEKLRTNLVRCLGNLLKILQTDEIQYLDFLCEQAILIIAKNIRSKDSMKLKWNACYAAQSLMKNQLMFQPKFRAKWQHEIFKNLFDEVLTSSNFKVKINCVNAISSAEKRVYYGLLLNECFKTLIEVFINSNNLVDYNEYKHKEALQEVVCLSLSHFFLIMKIEDVDNFAKVIEASHDVIKELWIRSLNRMVPEKFETVSKVFEAFNTLKSNKNCSPAVQDLINCFVIT